MPYYAMAYRMANLQPALRPPDALSGLTDIMNDVTGAISSAFGVADTAIASTLAAGQKAGWCSSSNPQTGCTAIKGICIPTGPGTTVLDAFKNLQRQANRMAAKEGRPLIGVDGRIGPGTVNAVADALRYAPTRSGLSWSSIKGKPCELIAGNALALTLKIKTLADATNTPQPPDPPKSVPSVAGAGGVIINPPPDVIQQSAMDGTLFAWIPASVRTPLGIAALVAGGLLIRKAMKSPGSKRGRARRKRSSSGRRRRGR